MICEILPAVCLHWVLFSGRNILAVHFTCLPNGKPNGGAYVDFASAAQYKMALQHPVLSNNIKG